MKKIRYLFIMFGVLFSVVLTACQKEVCTVTFEHENGEFIQTVNVYSGDKVSKPDNVKEIEGYTFDAWYLNGVEYSFDSKVEENITLVARYNGNHYTLSFGYDVPPIDVTYGKPIGELPKVPFVDGKDYGVWTLDGAILTSTTVYNYTEDKEAVANYDELCSVTFVTEEEKVQYITYGSKVTEPRIPQKAGYDFIGWYVDDEKYDFNSAVKGDIVLESKWKPRNDTPYIIYVYTEVDGEYVDVTDEYENITTDLIGTTEETVDITEIANQAIPSNYVLNVEDSTLEGTIVGDGSLVLSIYYDIVRYTVSFDVEEVLDQLVPLGSTASMPTVPEKDGFVFHSWLLGENEYDFSTNVSGDINLVAKWLEVKDHVITFDSLHDIKIKVQSLSDGETIVKPVELNKVGYDFDGWYFGNEKWDFNTSLTATHEKNINLVAKWIPHVYELSFDEDDVESISVTYGKPIGELPALKYLTQNNVGNWFIDGAVIDSQTIWNFDSDMIANSMYFVDMLSETLDLSTRGEDDLNTQILNVLGLSGVSVDKIREDGVEISNTFLNDIEENATDENSRTKTLVVNIGNTEYKLKVFFATKVIYNYEELTKIQEYGGVVESKFPVIPRLLMYGYSGYFILANDIDASASMTTTYIAKTIGEYNSQTWVKEMTGFVGVFDGRGHTIDKLHTGAGGLLGDVLSGSVIKNLSITNAKIVKDQKAGYGAGILCYVFSHATIENVYVDFTTNVSNSGLFGRMNQSGKISNVVIKYTNTAGVSGGAISAWQVVTTANPVPEYENVSIIYANGTDVTRNKMFDADKYPSDNVKEYILQNDGSLLAITKKTYENSDKKKVTKCTTASLVGGEFAKYNETYWDLSGAYPVFK